MRRLNTLLVVLLLIAGPSLGQGARVRGYFRGDSTAIGAVVPYILTATYPRDTQVLFPDSTFSFAPFEASGKTFFPTRTSGGLSYDSAVYYLTTFEIDSVQRLSLPVFVIQPQDCVAVFAPADSVRLQYRVTMALDSISVEKLPLKTNTAYQRVKWIFNYPVLLILLGVVLVLALVAWFLFGKRIRTYFALRRLKRGYEQFLRRYADAVERLGTENSPRPAEEALVLWKGYMEELEHYPFTKSTSREIIRKFADDALGQALRTIDRGIYGGFGTSRDPFLFLQSYSQQQFQKREAELRNG